MNMSTLVKKFLTFSLMTLIAVPPLALAQEPKIGEKMAAVELYWATREPEDVARRAHALAQLVAGRELESKSIGELLTQRGRSSHWMDIGQGTNLKLKYLPQFDELRIINQDLMHVVDAGDIGETSAMALAEEILEDLANRDLINLNAVNLKNAQVGYAQVGGGAKDGSFQSEQTTQYRITFRHEINGIELANAGVRLAIHASGKLAGIRLGGVSARGEYDGGTFVPSGKGYIVERRVADEDIEDRFRRSIPKGADADVTWARLMYVMPDDTQERVVEPMRIYSYSLQFSSDEGQLVSSRRKIMGYSLSDSNAQAFDFTAPAEKHEGQEPTRN